MSRIPAPSLSFLWSLRLLSRWLSGFSSLLQSESVCVVGAAINHTACGFQGQKGPTRPTLPEMGQRECIFAFPQFIPSSPNFLHSSRPSSQHQLFPRLDLTGVFSGTTSPPAAILTFTVHVAASSGLTSTQGPEGSSRVSFL